jgi:hypothetical protein
VDIGGKPYIWYHARAYRFPEDPYPADGWAAEPVPGPTSFTKDSELMNAETAAWGRAIAALGFATKKIASAEEVRNRQEPPKEPTDPNTPLDDTKKAEVEEYAKAAGLDFWKVSQEVLGAKAGTYGQAKRVCQEISKRKQAK